MIWLIQDLDLFSVLLRAFTLSFEALAVGGVIFLLLAATPALTENSLRSSLARFTSWAALALAVTQALSALESAVEMMNGSGLGWHDVLTAGFFLSDAVIVSASILLWVLLRFAPSFHWFALLLALTITGSSVALSHAASRLEDRALLVLLTAAHHLGSSAWIGAMPSLLVALRKGGNRKLVQRYSAIAIAGVTMLVLAGLGMARFYVGSWNGLYGTSYGMLVLAKVYLFAMTVVLGAGNFLLARAASSDPAPLLKRLRRVSEVEIGLGFTAILVAASLTSQPAAVDVGPDQLSKAEIVQRLEWHWPELHSPDFSQLKQRISLSSKLQDSFSEGAENDVMDRAWSEYNHHWAGLIVLLAGTFALIARFRRQAWARNWPLLFICLAVFIVLRADPEAWPLGPRPFWASFAESEVLEHRFFALLIVGFAVFQWAVETGRWQSPRAALVFPGLCAIGGAVLLTHSHAFGNVKDETLVEISHSSIALLGATAGWSRWMELRLPPDSAEGESRLRTVTRWIWPVCLILVGVVLLDYREA
ncbi:copper resistance D family protein [Silvibacterium acidisoli]|uniref:copper resistance D family protein n=1 Tax=Acidobacteriaceae bacterium ZG23-2 TaxID=2883246 RepID=UPI00406CBDDF